MQMMKWILFSVVGLALAVFALFAGLAAFTDATMFKNQIVLAIRKATGLETTFEGGIELKLFPRLGLRLGKTHIGNPDGFGVTPFASLDEADVEVEIWPLLMEKRLVAHTVSLTGLAVSLVRHADGKANWEQLIPKKVTVEKDQIIVETNQGQALAFNYDIEGFKLENALIQYNDQGSGQNIRLSQVNLSTGSVRPLKPIDVKGSGAVDLGVPVVKGQIDFSGQAAFDPVQKSLEFTKAIIKSRVTTEKLPLRDSSQTLQGNFYINAETTAVSGKDIVISASSNLTGLPVERVDSNFQGNFELSPEGVLSLPGASMDLLAKGKGFPERGMSAKAKLNANFDTRTQLAKLSGLDLSVNGFRLSGELQGQLAGESPRLDGKLAVKTESLRTSLTELGVSLPALSPNVLGKFSSNIVVRGSLDAVTASFEHLALDSTTGTASLTAKAKGHPQIAFDINLDTVNLPAYLPVQEAAQPHPAPAKASKSNADNLTKTLRELSLNGSFRINTLITPKLTLSQVAGKLSAREGVIEVSPLSCQVASGGVKASVRTDARSAKLAHAVNLDASDLHVGTLTRAFANKDLVDGRFFLTANVTASGDEPAELERSLGGTAKFRMTNGVVKGVTLATDIFSSVEKLLGAVTQLGSGPAKTDIQNAQASFSIAQGVASTKDLLVQSNPHKISGVGSINIPQQTMDFRLDAAIAGLGTIPVGVNGPMSDPKINVDSSALAKAAVRGVTSTVGNVISAPLSAPKILQDTGKGLLEGVGKFFGPSSQPAQPQKK